VQKHFADVALLRGTASPQVAGLRDCLDEAEPLELVLDSDGKDPTDFPVAVES
jgi:hypothetical protein